MLRACLRCGLLYRDESEYCGIDGSPIAAVDRDPLVGRTVGRYRVLEYIGMGGVAALYRARHVVMENEVALKVLFGEMASASNVTERFRREAWAACRIRHRNVVRTFDYDVSESGVVYLAMELLEGRALSDVIDAEGQLPPPRAREIARQIALGLSAIHALGFVHRDIKPSNIMLVREDERETVKILDFGLVRAHEEPAEPSKLTRSGALLGTPHYMAPEMIGGDPISASADLYGLGSTLYEMLAGEPPFLGPLAEILVQHLRDPPPSLPPSEGLEELANALLAKRAEERPKSAEEVVAWLEPSDRSSVLSHLPSSLKPPTEEIRRPSHARLRWWRWIPIAAAVVIALMLADPPEEDEAPAIPAITEAHAESPPPPVEIEIEPRAPSEPVRIEKKPAARKKPAIIEVSIDSVPSGARVSMAGGVLGITPLTATFRSDMEAALLFEKDGSAVTRKWSRRIGRKMVVQLD